MSATSSMPSTDPGRLAQANSPHTESHFPTNSEESTRPTSRRTEYAHTDSDESTQPNSPRTEYARTDSNGSFQTNSPPPKFHSALTTAQIPSSPRPVSRDGDAEFPAASHSSSDDSRRTRGSIYPTWPKSVSIKNARADVKWQPDAHLTGAYFDLHWTCQDNTEAAFFRFSVQIESSDADDVTRLYILIPPEHIQTLTTNSSAEQRDGLSTRTLSFVMLKPPVLVAPKDFKGPSSAAIPMVQSIYDFAMQLSFTAYINVSYYKCSSNTLQHICTAVSESNLPSIKRFAISKIATLFQGKGGKVLEGTGLSDRNACPPAYSFQADDDSKYPCE